MEELKECSYIQLLFQGNPSEYFCHNHFQVHYLHAWLAAQLDWIPQSFETTKDSKKIIYKRKQGSCLVEIKREEKETNPTPGQITYLEIRCPSKNKFICSHNSNESFIEVKISNEEKPKEIYNSFLMQINWEKSLSREICYQKTSQHYSNMLSILASIKGLI